eukprot:GHUV01021066.1.p1 GENE.GHUV01021066.1~~GHUV01021066.1.p1  ORF type:complete len:106 (+),score=25.28 GHUV01021066.1:45-362(+)
MGSAGIGSLLVQCLHIQSTLCVCSWCRLFWCHLGNPRLMGSPLMLVLGQLQGMKLLDWYFGICCCCRRENRLLGGQAAMPYLTAVAAATAAAVAASGLLAPTLAT